MKMLLAIIATALLVLPFPATARIGEDMVCWDPDIEYPLICDDED
jgi:hypothetical protein